MRTSQSSILNPQLIIAALLLLSAQPALAQWPWSNDAAIEPDEQSVQEPSRRSRQRARGDRREPRQMDDGCVDVALLLPLQGAQTTAPHNFLEFYQGARLAVEELGRQGIAVRLNLYDTHRSVEEVERIVADEAFEQSDLIIGPVYEEELQPVLEFADNMDVALVSPLAKLDYSSSPMLFQLPPDPMGRYAKLRRMLNRNGDAQVILVRSGADDQEFLHEVLPLLPAGYGELFYSRETPSRDLELLLRGGRELVFVVVAEAQSSIDDFLARIGSLQKGLSGRGAHVAPIRLIGSSRWQRLPNIDRNLFFRLNLSYITSYHADASDERVRTFNRRYVAAYGALPSLYSYRGYDAVKLFATTVASQDGLRFEDALNAHAQELLQTPYHFDDRINMEWALVNYRDDYTIVVE